jgi:hypothetical protein
MNLEMEKLLPVETTSTLKEMVLNKVRLKELI